MKKTRMSQKRKNSWQVAVRLTVTAVICLLTSLGMGNGISKAAEEGGQTTLYGIGSTSKVVTTAAVMQLYKEGNIELDKPLTTYIPEFSMADDRYRSITPRMLLDHSSGLQGSTLTNAMLFDDPDRNNHDALLSRLQTQRLKAEPGEFGVYCNDGFTLAEILVERVSGMTFTDYLQKKFAEPLGLKYLATPQTPGIGTRLAAIYDQRTGIELPPESPNVIGSGGMYMTAEDLCRLSQIFMMDQAGREKEEVLNTEMAEAMAVSDYEPYGLGWDNVNAYPFPQYGIQALVKGGDTSYYHGSLTVLPEENLSCAVLTSGGSSMVCQLAVQEILLSYLEETGRIKRESEAVLEEGKKSPSSHMPEEYEQYSGWYTGNAMMKVEIQGDGKLTLSTVGTGRDKSQEYVHHEDGAFYSTGGMYINSSGELSKGSSGRVGRSALRFQTDEKGRTYLMAEIYEIYPGLGTWAVAMPIGEKLPEDGEKGGIKTGRGGEIKAGIKAWQEHSEKDYYLVSEKYSSAFYYSRFLVKPRVLVEPEGASPSYSFGGNGYLVFDDSALKTARIESPEKAAFFQQIPVQVGRDLSDYRISEKDGKTYLHTSSWRYLCEDGMEQLPGSDTAITIGGDGETKWYVLDELAEYGFLTIEESAKAAYYIYDSSGKEMRCVGSSWTMAKEKEFLLPRKGKIAFAGEPGETFKLHFSK